ncbi:hypothetical protein Poly51_25830 [Rubripirellula tenax]|uniref:Tetratricopeptide repeat protein n=1 Tax=Rubripirellula tenax TaxID=2528015 RepID=A0A5C6F931_9BACT|nr:tetratricopeptide repeat protein [Rubripirellula tenax]TWU56666.1 hypothetical protein Poly51_25830 [Rubripirellula tenax]
MSARIKSNQSKKQATNTSPVASNPNASPPKQSLSPALQRALGLIQKNDYAGAANSLSAAGRDPQVRNTLGVCLMRMGRVDAAVDTLRSLVLMPGTLIERCDVSNAAKRNFATALLMKGLPSGALSVLAEIHEPENLMAIRLHAAIKQWEKSLPWLRRLDWKINGIEPSHCCVPLDFEPGEFDFEVNPKSPIKPGKSSKGSLKLAA